MAAAGLLLAVSAGGAAAQPAGSEPTGGLIEDDPAFAEAAPFRDGAWTGSLSAAGPVAASFVDADISMHTAMAGMFDVLVVDDVVAAGSWNLSGSSFGTVVTGFGTGMVRNSYLGAGPVGGDQDALELGGGVDTTWEISFGGPTDVSQDPQRLGPFEVVVTHADCQRLVGSWESAFAAELAQAGGWESQLTGTFAATHTDEPPEQDLLDAVYDHAEAYNTWVDDVRAGVYAQLETSETTSLVDAALDPVLDLLADGYDLERQLADLSDDEACLFGQDLGTFSFLLTAALQDLAWWLLGTVDDLTADDLELLGRALLASGGLGEGAIRPERTAELEARFAERAGQALEPYWFDDQPPDCTPSTPCLDPEPEVVALSVLLVQLGLPVEIAGSTVSPEAISTGLAAWEEEQP